VDYPNKLAAVVFVPGCPWRCGYCHNPHLQTRSAACLSWKAVAAQLKRRLGFIDAIVFSGGEATCDPGLVYAMQEMRDYGFQIGLHTGGAYFERLITLLPLLQWIGLDIKAPLDHRYDTITGVKNSAMGVKKSLDAILASGIAYECRTTIHPALIQEDEIIALADTLVKRGVTHYALQVFRAQGCMNADLKLDSLLDYPHQACREQLKSMFACFEMR
jgi:anaerobic ribonucleoside-triphosphate reductase activating protein